MHDNHVILHEPSEVFLLSQAFWQMFRDRYGCDIVIQFRKYQTFEKLLPSSIIKGPVYSSFDFQPETWFVENVESLSTLPQMAMRQAHAQLAQQI
jgi:hypothetical protein